jgi:ActR/RegA family two-component response regulator
MGLHCLLLTSDTALLKVIGASLSAVGIELEIRTNAASAIDLSARRHLDSFAIDCGVSGATDVLALIRNSRANKLSVIFAVVSTMAALNTAIRSGADFVLGRPVQDKLLRSFLDVARPRMEREHRRYFRHKVNLPVELLRRLGETYAGKIVNVSEGGLALTRFRPAPIEGVVTVQFALPSTTPQTFQARAEVVWNDASSMGLRFLTIEPLCRSCFARWLDSLEAQLQFRKLTQST